MPTRAAERPGLGEAAKAVAEHASAIARLELELAGLEVKRKLKPLGLGIALLVGAAFFGLLGLLVAVAAVTAAIALVLPVWAAILVVLGGVLGLVALLGLLGLASVRRGTPPVPEAAIEEAKLTTEVLRNGRG